MPSLPSSSKSDIGMILAVVFSIFGCLMLLYFARRRYVGRYEPSEWKVYPFLRSEHGNSMHSSSNSRHGQVEFSVLNPTLYSQKPFKNDKISFSKNNFSRKSDNNGGADEEELMEDPIFGRHRSMLDRSNK